jgi:MarR family protein
MSRPGERDGSWTLLTGHGHVLVEIARNPGARIRDISAAAGITERTVQAIVADLEAAGYLTRTRTGRRTRYTVNPDSPFRHPTQEGLRVGPFLAVLAAPGDTAEPAPAARPHGSPAPAAPADHDHTGPGTPGPGRSR